MVTLPDVIRRIVYFGSPEVAVKPLRALCSAGYHVELVVTRPPKRRTRRGKPAATPVALTAQELGLPVAAALDEKAVSDAVARADLGVVVAYGELIGTELLEQLTMVNLHFSLLPRWRGAAPVEWAILSGDTETGVSLLDVAPEIDTGSVYCQETSPIAVNETASELRARLCDIGVKMLLQALQEGLGTPVPQSGIVTFADKIKPADLRIDWSASAEHIHRVVRVGGAWTTFRGRRLKITKARWHPTAPATTGSNMTNDSRVGDGGRVGDGRVGVGSGAGVDGRVGGDGRAVDGGVRGGGRVGDGGAGGDGRAGADDRVGTVMSAAGGIFVGTGDGLLELLVVQAAGRAAVTAAAWRNGARLAAGERFDH